MWCAAPLNTCVYFSLRTMVTIQGSLLQTWFIFNPNRDKNLRQLYNVGWNYLFLLRSNHDNKWVSVVSWNEEQGCCNITFPNVVPCVYHRQSLQLTVLQSHVLLKVHHTSLIQCKSACYAYEVNEFIKRNLSNNGEKYLPHSHISWLMRQRKYLLSLNILQLMCQYERTSPAVFYINCLNIFPSRMRHWKLHIQFLNYKLRSLYLFKWTASYR